LSEMGFMLFQHISSGAETVLCAFCMAAFFRPYMAGRKNRLQKTIAVFLAYGTVYVAGEAFSISGWLCISHILKNRLYCGELEYRKEYVPDYLEQKRAKNKGVHSDDLWRRKMRDICLAV